MLGELIPNAPWGSSGVAVVTSNGIALTYAELEAQVKASRPKVPEGGVVTIRETTPLAFLIAALAAWSAGAVVFPLDARAPTSVNDALAGRVTSHAVDPRAALLLATSGSSAEPKLVVLGREGIAANVQAIRSYLPAVRVGVVVPLSYSYGLVGQVLTTLDAGGALVLLGDLPYPIDQVAALRSLGVEGLSSVPASLRILARAVMDTGDPLELAYVASAGGALDAGTVELARAAFRPRAFYNQYGLTEASPRVTAGLVDDESSVGRPLPGIEVCVRDADASGEGEIAVRGPNVMLGYLGDPEGTAKVLSTDGWLRTGDRGRVADRVWISGRADGVVKVAGERVSVEEVAAALRRGEDVRDAAVVALPHPELGARLVAFVEGSATGAREAAKQLLGPAKRPSKIVSVDALPRTANGKIASAELRQMAGEVR